MPRVKKNISEYISLNGKVAPVFDEVLDSDQLYSEKIILGLRMSDGIGSEIYSGLCADTRKKRFCDNLLKNNMAKIHPNGNFALTPQGWLVSNTIIEELM